MKISRMWEKVVIRLLIAVILAIPATTLSAEQSQRWEILNPEGVIRIDPMEINPHPATLEGKTVLLRWNGKHNGDTFLDRVAELLTQKIKDVKIIKSWEVAPETVRNTGIREDAVKVTRQLAACKPDIDKFCASEPHGHGKIRACLEANKDKLAPECKTALEKAPQEKSQ